MHNTYKGIDYVTTTASGVEYVETNLGYVSEKEFKLIIDESLETDCSAISVRGN